MNVKKLQWLQRKTHGDICDNVCQGWPKGGSLNLPVKILIRQFAWAQPEGEGIFKGVSSRM